MIEEKRVANRLRFGATAISMRDQTHLNINKKLSREEL